MYLMIRRLLSSLVMLATLSLTGCGRSAPPATLVVHFHDDVYDLINHDGNVIRTARSLDAFELMLEVPAIKQLIRDHRVVARFAGIETKEGLDAPTEVDLLLVPLLEADVYNVSYEYTNATD